MTCLNTDSNRNVLKSKKVIIITYYTRLELCALCPEESTEKKNF